ncbi:MAG: response regulator [Bacteroidia bacterium]|nr:response regulator [Bacteroidia bacterium]
MQSKILIVEDEAIIALDIELNLKQLGYEVCGICSDYSSAIQKVKSEKPNLVILDINLNNSKSGIEIANYIRLNHNIPYIFLTAFNDNKTFNEALSSSPYGYINKPFQHEDLRNVVAIAIEKWNNNNDIDFETVLNLLDKMDEAAIIINPKDEVVTLNKSFQKLTGYLVDDLKKSLLKGVFNAHANTLTGELILRNKDIIKTQFEMYEISETSENKSYKLYQFKQNKTKQNFDGALGELMNQNQYIFIKHNTDLHKVFFDEILWIEAMDNYVKIVTENKTYVASYYISEIETKLPSSIFIRVHRSYIVSLKKLAKIIENGVIINEQTIPVSRSYKPILLSKINTI